MCLIEKKKIGRTEGKREIKAEKLERVQIECI